MKTKLILLTVLAGFAVCGQAADTGTLSVESTQQPNNWTIRYKGQKVLVYSFAPGVYKTYVKELSPPTGDNILRDAPFDHLHHHALMYGITVNGVDFWGETPGCGVQKAVATSKPEISTDAKGRLQAIFEQTIHWVAPQDAFLPDTSKMALLIERRAITLIVDEAAKETTLQWNAKFEVGPKTNQVTLTGANYHGLGVRFLQELDPFARHVNSGNTPDLSDNKQDVTPGAWGSVSFNPPGKPATLVIYGDPANRGGPAKYFTMRTPFAYISATQGLDKNPLVYRAGETFQLSYTVAVYPELKSSEFLAQRVKP